jgi:hypothetical protein
MLTLNKMTISMALVLIFGYMCIFTAQETEKAVKFKLGEIIGSDFEPERERLEREFRSQGAEAAERIKADADRQDAIIISEAYRDAEKLRGSGDAKAVEIYAGGYSQDPEFFALY